MRRFIVVLVSLLILFLTIKADAADTVAGLAWDAPVTTAENRVEGYNIWWGTETGKYPNRLDVGNVLVLKNIVEVLHLKSSTTYNFVVTAYNGTGNSAFSNSPNYETPMVLKVPPGVTITIRMDGP